ncbi:MAG TPA: AAA family ATPase [Thermoanaerobaculia bacterium]|nr:AAA family ATPase [Thermoanaerobaculia bacterium]
MRIAVSGSHRTGKSTLVEALSKALPEHSAVEEPYRLLEEEGYEFTEMPSVEDFELQLERSIGCLKEGEPNVIFDRCPADFLGYLLTHSEAELFDLERWLSRVQAAVETLDLVVFVPVEERDRIPIPSSEDADLRMEVDEKLKEILLDNEFDFDVDVLEVTGAPRERVQRVMACLR